MGVAAMNIAAVELFDEMNTVNEKVITILGLNPGLVHTTAPREDL